jgi:LPS-assembly protein
MPNTSRKSTAMKRLRRMHVSPPVTSIHRISRFRTKRMKIINNKLGVTGRVYPEIESVPIPMVFLPFGLFPLNRARHSGVLLPSFTSSQDFGLGLEGLGYYKVFGEHVDVTTRANLYSYGDGT